MKKSVQLFRTFVSVIVKLWIVSVLLLLTTNTYEPGHIAAPWLWVQMVSSIILLMSSVSGQYDATFYRHEVLTKLIQLTISLWLFIDLTLLHHVVTKPYTLLYEPYMMDHIAVAISLGVTVISLASVGLYFIYSTIKPPPSR